MRIRESWLLVLFAALVLVGVSARLVTHAANQASTVGAQSQTSPIFTPAHRTLLDAVRDFFSYHPTPVQPIAYTHKVHLANGMECTNCHVNVEKGAIASIPNIKLCMTCHQVVATDKPEIKKMAAMFERGEQDQ